MIFMKYNYNKTKYIYKVTLYDIYKYLNNIYSSTLYSIKINFPH